MNYPLKFTIFTPCYNSEKFIHRVYESIKAQTYRNFEWMVIDDCSTDNTPNIINQYIKEADFPIQYIRNSENKMITQNYNIGVPLAKGELFLLAGHDDSFIPTTLEVFLSIWDSYSDDEKKKFAGVSCLCVDQFGNIIGDKYPEDRYISNYNDIIYTRKIKGEKWGFIRTDVMKEFPMYTVGTYVDEGLIWFEIGQKYKKVHVNVALRTYFINQEHANLSKIIGSKKIRWPEGNQFYYNKMLNEHLYSVKGNYKLKLKWLINYIRYSYMCKKSTGYIIRNTQNLLIRFLTIIFLPVGWAFFKYNKFTKRI